MKHIKQINEVFGGRKDLRKDLKWDDTTLVSELAEEIIEQTKNINRTAIKKTTWISIMNDLIPAILKDGNNFDDTDRKLFKKEKEQILKKVLSKIV